VATSFNWVFNRFFAFIVKRLNFRRAHFPDVLPVEYPLPYGTCHHPAIRRHIFTQRSAKKNDEVLPDLFTFTKYRLKMIKRNPINQTLVQMNYLRDQHFT
jgi:hypothetical protein